MCSASRSTRPLAVCSGLASLGAWLKHAGHGVPYSVRAQWQQTCRYLAACFSHRDIVLLHGREGARREDEDTHHPRSCCIVRAVSDAWQKSHSYSSGHGCAHCECGCATSAHPANTSNASHCGRLRSLQPLQPTRNPLHRLFQARQALRVGNAYMLIGAVVAEIDAGRERNMFGFQEMRAKRLRII